MFILTIGINKFQGQLIFLFLKTFLLYDFNSYENLNVLDINNEGTFNLRSLLFLLLLNLL